MYVIKELWNFIRKAPAVYRIEKFRQKSGLSKKISFFLEGVDARPDVMCWLIKKIPSYV